MYKGDFTFICSLYNINLNECLIGIKLSLHFFVCHEPEQKKRRTREEVEKEEEEEEVEEPEQLTPSPSCPSLHMQLNDPWVLMHIAFT